MTALKPIENRRVLGVSARRYPINLKCAHPECNEPAVDPHHIFPKSLITNDSWFVLITEDGKPDTETTPEKGGGYRQAIPHVSGLCRAHHDAVELHNAWIKLEDGEFVWYDRVAPGEYGDDWKRLGALNPQPGSREGRPKRKRFQGEAKRKRRTISIRVPDDEVENGAELYDELMDQLKALWEMQYPYPIIMRCLYLGIQDAQAEKEAA